MGALVLEKGREGPGGQFGFLILVIGSALTPNCLPFLTIKFDFKTWDLTHARPRFVLVADMVWRLEK